ncbi:hypothetical protein KI387_029737, partial [Taxus chinensis]
YVDDLLAKSKCQAEHLTVLETIFDSLIKYCVCLQPKKCVFTVLSGKIMGFIVSLCGIEVDAAKVKTILEIPPSTNLKQLCSLQ